MSASLRANEPVDLDLRGPLPRDLHPAEIGPLVRAIEADDADVASALRAWAAPAGPSGGSAREASDDPSPGGEPEVTALIPSSRHVPWGIASLRGQDRAVDVVVLSNGAGPRDAPGARTERVRWEGHGVTRQRAIQKVQTRYVLLTVDDAIPLGVGFVGRLIDGLEVGDWDAVIARQVPWPDADPVTRARLRAWTPPVWSDASRPMLDGAPAGVTVARQLDHVCALFKTETLLATPLPDVPIAEDAWWGRGRRIGLVVGAPVLHSHPRRAVALFHRERAIHAERARMGEHPTVPDLPSVIRGALGALRLGPLEVMRHTAEAVGQWSGARAAARAISRPMD